MLAQVVQRCRGSSIPGDIQGQDVWGSEQSDPVSLFSAQDLD